MALSVFDDREALPTDRAIAKALGKASRAWADLKEKMALDEEWAFAGEKWGWSLRLKRGKRVIIYMTPGAGHFLASFALGEKACTAARDAGLPAALLQTIADAPRYAEGRGIRIPVRTLKDAAGVRKLAQIKMDH